jgi:hypothetical protein
LAELTGAGEGSGFAAAEETDDAEGVAGSAFVATEVVASMDSAVLVVETGLAVSSFISSTIKQKRHILVIYILSLFIHKPLNQPPLCIMIHYDIVSFKNNGLFLLDTYRYRNQSFLYLSTSPCRLSHNFHLTCEELLPHLRLWFHKPL